MSHFLICQYSLFFKSHIDDHYYCKTKTTRVFFLFWQNNIHCYFSSSGINKIHYPREQTARFKLKLWCLWIVWITSTPHIFIFQVTLSDLFLLFCNTVTWQQIPGNLAVLLRESQCHSAQEFVKCDVDLRGEVFGKHYGGDHEKTLTQELWKGGVVVVHMVLTNIISNSSKGSYLEIGRVHFQFKGVNPAKSVQAFFQVIDAGHSRTHSFHHRHSMALHLAGAKTQVGPFAEVGLGLRVDEEHPECKNRQNTRMTLLIKESCVTIKSNVPQCARGALKKIPRKNKTRQVLKPVTKFRLLWKDWIYLPKASGPMTSMFLEILFHRAFTTALSFLFKLMLAVVCRRGRF